MRQKKISKIELRALLLIPTKFLYILKKKGLLPTDELLLKDGDSEGFIIFYGLICHVKDGRFICIEAFKGDHCCNHHEVMGSSHATNEK